MTTAQSIRILGLAIIAAGAAACGSAPEPDSPTPRRATEAEPLLPSQVTDVELAACVAGELRDAAEGYANRRARARAARFRSGVEAATLAETSSRAAVQASANALSLSQLAASNSAYMNTARMMSLRAVQLSADALRFVGSTSSAGATGGEGPDVMTPDEAVQAASRAAEEVERSTAAATRYARLTAFHAEAFELALAAARARGEASAAEAETANAELARAVAEWPDGEMLYRVNFATASAQPPSRCAD